MGYSDTELNRIFSKSPGSCYICKRATILQKYGTECQQGSWEVDHDMPESRGGADAMPNWYPACFPCNREKSDKTADEFKQWINNTYSGNMSKFRDDMWKKYCS